MTRGAQSRRRGDDRDSNGGDGDGNGGDGDNEEDDRGNDRDSGETSEMVREGDKPLRCISLSNTSYIYGSEGYTATSLRDSTQIQLLKSEEERSWEAKSTI